MSNIKIIAAGASDAPSIPTASAVFGLMNEIADFQDQNCETLCYEQYENLSESATVLQTLGNLLSAASAASFIAQCVAEAKSELAFAQQLLKPSD